MEHCPTSRNAIVPKKCMLCSSQPLHKPLSIYCDFVTSHSKHLPVFLAGSIPNSSSHACGSARDGGCIEDDADTGCVAGAGRTGTLGRTTSSLRCRALCRCCRRCWRTWPPPTCHPMTTPLSAPLHLMVRPTAATRCCKVVLRRPHTLVHP